MTRYSTVEEVDAALVQLEEHERSGEKHTDQEKLRNMSVSGSYYYLPQKRPPEEYMGEGVADARSGSVILIRE
ncbi:hypothetical protein L2E82_18302 [Cichorium intybus]|uniref:Uncharacterized protein n=1 Tax=Cichorium intybus TaxID=13427 RepID=A0ACB9F930_CICIN|nr:hypothetical protein L2E82_18302 [Cichorium intybus]